MLILYYYTIYIMTNIITGIILSIMYNYNTGIILGTFGSWNLGWLATHPLS